MSASYYFDNAISGIDSPEYAQKHRSFLADKYARNELMKLSDESKQIIGRDLRGEPKGECRGTYRIIGSTLSYSWLSHSSVTFMKHGDKDNNLVVAFELRSTSFKHGGPNALYDVRFAAWSDNLIDVRSIELIPETNDWGQ